MKEVISVDEWDRYRLLLFWKKKLLWVGVFWEDFMDVASYSWMLRFLIV